MHTMPIFYYNSTVMLVDDDEMFTRALSNILRDKYITKSFNNPKVGLAYYQNKDSLYASCSLLKPDTGHDRYDAINYVPVGLNIADLQRLNANPARKDEISVLIVDYDMPEMNGVELCRRLAGYSVKKILLTGMATISIAIDALNKGEIDCYLTKGSEKLAEEIHYHVNMLMNKYYSDLTAPLLSHLEADNKLALSDPKFVEYVNDNYLSQSACEYSLIDKNGSLVIREDDQTRYLIVQTEKSMDNFVELNDDVADATPYLDSVKARESIPFFGVGAECWQFPVSEWSEHFYEPIRLTGREEYYLAVIDEAAI